MLQKQTHSFNSFSLYSSFSSLGTHRVHTFRNVNRSCIMLNHGNTQVQLLLCLLLSSCQLESTLPPAAQLFLSQCQQGDLVGHRLLLSNPSENFSTQLWTALCDKHFPPQTGNISLWISLNLVPFPHKENAQENAASSLVYTSSTVAILTTETNLWTCTWACTT
jgi:hypothetical protein